MATTTAPPCRCAPELRQSSLVLLVVSRDQKSPWMPLASPFPSSATEDRRRQIRHRSAFPEPAVHLYGIHVSSSVVSPSPLTRFLPLTPTTVGAESSSPPAMSPPWPRLPRAATEHAAVLSAPPGGHSTHPHPLLCSLTPTPSSPELRRLPSSSPAPIPAAPTPTDSTGRRGALPAIRRAPPPSVWSPEQETRRPPPPRPHRRLNAGGISPADQGFDPRLTPLSQ